MVSRRRGEYTAMRQERDIAMSYYMEGIMHRKHMQDGVLYPCGVCVCAVACSVCMQCAVCPA